VTGTRARPSGVSWRAVLAVIVVIPFIAPFIWLVASAFKPIDQFYAAPPTLLPDPPSLANLQAVVDLLDVPRLFANSTFIALTVAGATVLVSSIVGFAFATLPARGSRVLFGVLIATILIPPTVAIVPQFILFSRIGWVGSYLPLIVPSLFGSAFAIFLFRQWFRNLPPNLFESAELEGATPLQAYRHIALPLARPVVAAVAVFAFVGSWNDFLGPLVYLRSPDTYTVSLGMATFQGVHVNDVHLSVAMALIALIPPILVFVIAQRALVHGIATGGFRG
jgi:ABC-type glycerol-3-phosphate transport system permease component